jgi:hypothetical protein
MKVFGEREAAKGIRKSGSISREANFLGLAIAAAALHAASIMKREIGTPRFLAAARICSRSAGVGLVAIT